MSHEDNDSNKFQDMVWNGPPCPPFATLLRALGYQVSIEGEDEDVEANVDGAD